jgi:hypothetical protein
VAKTINLDAMIVREDFAVEEANLTSNVLTTIGMNDLKGNLLSSVIRKPDFQRETHDWSPQNVLKFIDSIVSGQFIPSLILWKNSSGYIFVIDGAHRLSSLIQILTNLKLLLENISSKEPNSLGLHPIVYFYSRKGNFKVSAFYAILCFVKYLKDNDKFNDFTKIRDKFEGFIYQYDYITDQINRIQRSTKNSIPLLLLFYTDVMKYLYAGLDFQNVIDTIMKDKNYPKLLLDQSGEDATTSDFNSNRKSEVFISQAFPAALRCSICGGLLHLNSISIDHKIRIRDGGCGDATNGQATHFYCNTTYKN